MNTERKRDTGMNIKLIALDMDGTTLQNDHLSISPRTRRAIQTAIEQGILVVPATGRLDSLLPESVMGIEGIRYAITSNGAVTYDMRTKDRIHSSFIQPELALELLDFLPEDQILVEIFKDGKLFVDRDYLEALAEYPVPFLHLEFLKSIHSPVVSLQDYVRSDGDRIEKINLPYVPPEFQNALWNKLSELDSISLTSSVADNMEINDAKANKGEALQKLCEHLHIPAENVMAMGDNGNDIEMLKFAGISVAPANATDAAKAAAKALTRASDEDGVALAIEKYALQ